MAWALLFFALLHYGSGKDAKSTVTQPASQSVSLGETTKLPCSKSSGSWHSFYWYQQKPGQAPRLVFYSTSIKGEGIPDRFTPSISGNNGYLTISNTQAEDEAVYYCGAWEFTGSSKFHSDTI
uniref:Ig-like domain-containing protein n=1 Tax=Podarcis muralis TaxID=64176 RepID=A0A670JX38_PODMU